MAYVGPGGTVVIPDTINGLPVKSIGSNAFYYCTSMTSVTIPNNVTNIGRNAFYDCYNMTGVYFEGNAPISAYDSSVFSSDNAVIVYYLPGTTGWDRSFDGKITGLWSQIVPYNFTISNSAITITAYTGSGGGVVIPDTIYNLPVTSIGQSAFANCTSLTSVTIPASVTSIGDEAFYGCDGLTNVTIPASVTGLGHGAFAFCGSLTSVAIPDSVTNLGEYAFYSCGSLASATISTNVTSIAISAFDSCTGLTNVTIPNGVTNIGSSAFQNCASLGGVFIPTSVTNIGLYAFDSCGGLTAITVDPQNMNYSSVDGILINQGQSTLVQCPGGESGYYTVPNSVTSIGSSAFDSCASLTSVTIANSVGNISDFAFDGCAGLTNITIPNSVTNIGSWAFDGCSSLTSVTIPNGITFIRDHAFEDCSGLTNVTFGSGVSTIGGWAFDGCTNITGLYFQGNSLPGYSVSASAFSNNIHAIVYYLRGTTGWYGIWNYSINGFFSTMPWRPRVQTGDASFGVQTNQFGFNINWASGQLVVVETCTNLVNPVWSTMGTNTIISGTSYFSDPQWTNYPDRFYRVRSP